MGTVLLVSGPAWPVSLTLASWQSWALSPGAVPASDPPQGLRSTLTTVASASLAGAPMKSGVGGLASAGQRTTRPRTVAASSGTTSASRRSRARASTRAGFSLPPPWECPMGALSPPRRPDRGTLRFPVASGDPGRPPPARGPAPSALAGGDGGGDVSGPAVGGGVAVAGGGDGRLELLGDALVVGEHLGRLGVGEGQDPEVDEGLLDRVAPQTDALDDRDHPGEELLAVDRHDVGLLHELQALVDVEAEVAVELLGQDAVPEEVGGLDDEVLALPALGLGQVPVGVLEGEEAEGHVAGLVLHDVGVERAGQRVLGEVADEGEVVQGHAL